VEGARQKTTKFVTDVVRVELTELYLQIKSRVKVTIRTWLLKLTVAHAVMHLRPANAAGARPMGHGGTGKNAAGPLNASLGVVNGGRTTLQIQGEC
jgi:hypothetical protein